MLIPYLRHGVVLGPILFLIGVLIWIPLRIKNPIPYPNDPNHKKSIFDEILDLLLKNFFREFFAFCLAFGMFVTFLGNSILRNSSAFNTTVQIIQVDKQLEEIIGDFRSIGDQVTGSCSAEESQFEFSAYGTKGGTRVNIELINDNGDWKVKSLNFK
ncbi:hypothetical protein MY04_05585 [Flammeovirga sp. MY04]|uniref:hypothetical protein n=1 Tax=Flammeovirga sp. MY04 TaxID=1191459 RepID=UPI000824E4B5|nr:hypothetical protein [Flammeovirga sp. MY04]QJD09378.1 hypothetical protein MY04_05585 [Flammeovirga sp. MY04]